MAKRKTKYTLMVQHYDKRAQPLEENVDRARAERALIENASIQQGYHSRTGYVNGEFVVFGDDDIFATRIWIQEVRGGV
jgi:hypothetical protein